RVAERARAEAVCPRIREDDHVARCRWSGIEGRVDHCPVYVDEGVELSAVDRRGLSPDLDPVAIFDGEIKIGLPSGVWRHAGVGDDHVRSRQQVPGTSAVDLRADLHEAGLNTNELGQEILAVYPSTIPLTTVAVLDGRLVGAVQHEPPVGNPD